MIRLIIYLGIVVSSSIGAFYSYLMSDRLALAVFAAAAVLWLALLAIRVRSNP